MLLRDERYAPGLLKNVAQRAPDARRRRINGTESAVLQRKTLPRTFSEFLNLRLRFRFGDVVSGSLRRHKGQVGRAAFLGRPRTRRFPPSPVSRGVALGALPPRPGINEPSLPGSPGACTDRERGVRFSQCWRTAGWLSLDYQRPRRLVGGEPQCKETRYLQVNFAKGVMHCTKSFPHTALCRHSCGVT